MTERVPVAREGSRVRHLAEAAVRVHSTTTEYQWRGDTLCGRTITDNWLVVSPGYVNCGTCRSMP